MLPNNAVVILLAYHLLDHVSHFQLLRHLKLFAHIGQALCMTLSRPSKLDCAKLFKCKNGHDRTTTKLLTKLVNALLLSQATACPFNLNVKIPNNNA